jgi:hypothetical protein
MGFVTRANAVPSANAATNVSTKDVVGNKSDASFSNGSSTPSVIGHLAAGYQHVHNSSRVHPRTDDDTPLAAITVTGSATALTFGSWVEVIAANAIDKLFDMHFVLLGSVSAVDDYVLQLGYGGAGSEVFWGECAFTRDTNQMRAAWVPIQGPPIVENTRIAARLASTGGGSDTADIKIYTHQYPDVT